MRFDAAGDAKERLTLHDEVRKAASGGASYWAGRRDDSQAPLGIVPE